MFVSLSLQIDFFDHRIGVMTKTKNHFLLSVTGQVAPSGYSVKMDCPVFFETYLNAFVRL